jgi:sporulation protein YlmC with PRC-barrel domain
VLSLSRELGQDVETADGRVVGRVADLSVRLGGARGPHVVARLLVRGGRGRAVLVPWADVASFEHTGVLLRPGAVLSRLNTSTEQLDLEADELLLARDVLDTQIVDVAGQRLARVADVVLTRAMDERLELVGVEVGVGAVLRRLGLRRAAARAGDDVVAWSDLHLTSERGHSVQLATPRAAVHHLDSAGLAALVTHLDTPSAVAVLADAGPEAAAGAVLGSHPAVGERVLRAMPRADAAEIVGAMPDEHAHRWHDRLATSPRLGGRPFLRSRVWHRRRAATAPRPAPPQGPGP